MTGRGPDPNQTNTLTFETERLLMSIPAQEDAPILFGLIGGEHREEICATLLWDGPDDISDIEGWVHKARTDTFGESGFHWVVRDKTGRLAGAPGQPLGAIGTRPRGEPGRADVGYWLGRAFWGHGVMSEALRSLMELGFSSLDYYKMEADVYTHNIRGTRLVETMGMIKEGVIRRAYRKNGTWVDAAMYGILREEWRPAAG